MKFPKFLKDAFKKYASKFDAQDLKAKATRVVAAGGKSAIEKAQKEFPTESLKNAVEDLYATLVSPELLEGVTDSIKGLDEETIQGYMDGIVNKMKDHETATKIGATLKQVLNQVTPEQLEDLVNSQTDKLPLTQRAVVQFVVAQLRPILEDIKESSEDQVAEKIKDLAEIIPTDALAQQVASLTGNISPETINNKIQEKVADLPSPSAIAGAVDAASQVVKDKFSAATRAKTVETTKKAVADLGADVKKAVKDTIAKDKASKNKFNKGGKGESFEL